MEKLIELCDNCFQFKKTRFYKINNVSQVIKMALRLTTVNPSRNSTNFWAIFSELGGRLEKAEGQQAIQLIFLHWITAVTILAVKRKSDDKHIYDWLRLLNPEGDKKLLEVLVKDKVITQAQADKMTI